MEIKSIFKVASISLFFIVFVILSIYLYWSRERTIDFVKMLGTEVSVCGDYLNRDDLKFIALYKWLEGNKEGWQVYPVTQLPGYIYSSNNISINVNENFVVINYKTNSGYNQVTKNADTNTIIGQCKKDS